MVQAHYNGGWPRDCANEQTGRGELLNLHTNTHAAAFINDPHRDQIMFPQISMPRNIVWNIPAFSPQPCPVSGPNGKLRRIGTEQCDFFSSCKLEKQPL